jgi:hypothetical protein
MADASSCNYPTINRAACSVSSAVLAALLIRERSVPQIAVLESGPMPFGIFPIGTGDTESETAKECTTPSSRDELGGLVADRARLSRFRTGPDAATKA